MEEDGDHGPQFREDERIIDDDRRDPPASEDEDREDETNRSSHAV
jgi:hypothetical protein